jgi:two-component system KDP operon response regulator KdpE
MNQTVVLVVDDEMSIRDFLQRNLEVRGFSVVTAVNGIEALEIIDSRSIDLVVLDVMMPQMDGLEVTRRIRQTSVVPIIILTALGAEKDKVRAFDLGADDYLTKPFGVREFLARVKAVLRRSRWAIPPPRQGKLEYGDIVVDLEQYKVTVRDEIVKLTPTEFNLLVFLMENAGKALDHRVILKQVWGPEYGDEIEYLRVYIGHLRKKIEVDSTKPKYLITERGVGYRFQAD